MIKDMKKNDKAIVIILCVFFIFCLLFISPALARYRNRSISPNNIWNGDVASGFRSGNGTLVRPYIISSGGELAYLSSQLENNDYEGVYFKLANHIQLNTGVFRYNGRLEYVIENTTYYVNNENEYYDNPEFQGEAVGEINVFSPLDNFKGILDGDSYVIYGLYVNDDNAGLFTNLSGEISNLYISNAVIIGDDSGILSNNIAGGTIQNVMVDGYIVSSVYNGNGSVVDIIDSGIYTVSGGIAAYAIDTTFTNCINKAEIVGSTVTGGLVGYLEDSTIENAYSISNLSSYSSNTIGIIKGDSSINRVYSKGGISGGMVGYIIDADCSINNSFIVTDNDLVVDIVNSTIVGTNNYYVNNGRDGNITSTLTTINNLKDKNFLTNYSEFVDFEDLETHTGNVWVFEDGLYPVLYIDDIINPYVEINIGTYMWNSYSEILEMKKFSSNITFIVNDIDNVHNYNKYYYISNSQTSLSRDDLENVEWTTYSGIVQISEEGFYVVYVKVENGNEVSYINSDLLVLDKSEPTIDITIGDNHYSEVNDSTIFLLNTFTVAIDAEDELSGIKSIEYYISNDFLNDYNNISWTGYQSVLQINSAGEYVIYVKVVDGSDFVSYASSPLIIYDGYTSFVHPLGMVSGNAISSNSSIVYNFSYSNNRVLDLSHKLISSVVLPRYTNITLIDKENNKVYGYVINSNSDFGYSENDYATYDFSLFTEKGRSTEVSLLETEISNEEWEVILDFGNASIVEDYDNIEFYVAGYSDDELIRPTINHQTFSIKTNRNTRLSHTVSSNYNNSINYNSDSLHQITISSTVNYANNVYDTNYFDKKIGLSIKLVDSTGRIVSREYLKNFTFMVGEEKYTPEADNIIRINLNRNTSTSTVLAITTHQCTPKLREGTYYIKINAYSASDGLYYDSVIDNGIMIPVIVAKTVNNADYGFDVLIDSDSRIINKSGEVPLSFTIRQLGLEHPNIKVSMYAKDELTAYNQNYTLIDLGDYSDIQEDIYIPSVYYVSRSPSEEINYSFNLNTSLLNKTSYRFIFDLYDGNLKVSSVSKNIIIR